MSIQELIYFSSPVFIQNMLVSCYGYKLFRQRYSKNAKKYNHDLEKSAEFSVAEMHALQERRFVKIARHAIEFVPYYRNWALNNHITINDFNSLKDLSWFPILEKDEIKKNPRNFLSDVYLGRHDLFKIHTSGTTGKPLTIYCDRDSRTHHYAFFTRLRSWFGLDQNSKRATLFGRIILKPGQNSPPFWRYDYFQRNLLMSSYHLSNENLTHYYSKLAEYFPDEIIAYPSSIYQIAKYIVRQHLPQLKPKVVFTTAETLLPYQRTMIERAFNCPIIDQYGCTEMAFFASQCEHGTMHLHPEHGIFETVDSNGHATLEGNQGLAVATGFINYAMPLIRYKVGDIVVLSNGICRCGRAFPVLESVEGRKDDILTTLNGQPIGRLDPIFKGKDGIYETQIIQTAHDRIEFRIVKDEKFLAKEEKELIYEIRKRIGFDMRLDLIYVKDIPKDKNGKFKSVIRAISKQ